MYVDPFTNWGGGGGVLIIMHGRSLLRIDGARRVFADQADIACTKLCEGAGGVNEARLARAVSLHIRAGR